MSNTALGVQILKNENKIPKFLKYLGGTVIVLNALLLGFWGLVTGAQIFDISVAVGLIMMFTAIGFIVFAPAYFALSTLGWFENLQHLENKYEFWLKNILCFLAAVILPHIAYLIASFIALMIASVIPSLIN